MRLVPRIVAAAACLAAACTAVTIAVSAPASAATVAPAPHTPSGLPTAIEPMANYVGQTSCTPFNHAGTVKLAKLLASTYRAYSGSSYQTHYQCGTDGSQSEHYEGRAIDWMVGVGNSRQHAAANAAIKWLLATDSHGNRFAMARRLGVMYIIFDNRMWGAWDGRWEQYNGCNKLKSSAYANACHRTHVHISLSWNGANGKTSFWTKHLSATDYGPCRVRGLNWAYMYTHANTRGCQSFPKVKAAKGASATKRALVQYSGASVRRGWRGPAVRAVQAGLHRSQSGYFDTATANNVRSFQRAHHVKATGAMNPETWRALLAANK
jgi:peptidoglycan hydrolase-like protein with peptidoglycan-binding domain